MCIRDRPEAVYAEEQYYDGFHLDVERGLPEFTRALFGAKAVSYTHLQHKEISAKPADAGLCPKPFAFFCKFRHKYSIRRPHVVSGRRQICNILSIYYKLYASTL